MRIVSIIGILEVQICTYQMTIIEHKLASKICILEYIKYAFSVSILKTCLLIMYSLFQNVKSI